MKRFDEKELREMATIYVHRAVNGMAAVTDEQKQFVEYLMEHAPGAAKRLREFGITESLGCGESADHQLDELVEKVADGYYRNGTEYDLTLYGLVALEKDFLEDDRDPENDFCGITVWDKTPQEAADLVAKMIHDTVRSHLTDDPGIDDDEDEDEDEEDVGKDFDDLWEEMKDAYIEHVKRKARDIYIAHAADKKWREARKE